MKSFPVTQVLSCSLDVSMCVNLEPLVAMHDGIFYFPFPLCELDSCYTTAGELTNEKSA